MFLMSFRLTKIISLVLLIGQSAATTSFRVSWKDGKLHLKESLSTDHRDNYDDVSWDLSIKEDDMPNAASLYVLCSRLREREVCHRRVETAAQIKPSDICATTLFDGCKSLIPDIVKLANEKKNSEL
jgi:hypothetical protein